MDVYCCGWSQIIYIHAGFQPRKHIHIKIPFLSADNIHIIIIFLLLVDNIHITIFLIPIGNIISWYTVEHNTYNFYCILELQKKLNN